MLEAYHSLHGDMSHAKVGGTHSTLAKAMETDRQRWERTVMGGSPAWMGPTVLMPKRCSSCPAHTAVTLQVATVMGPSGPIHAKRLPGSTTHPAH